MAIRKFRGTNIIFLAVVLFIIALLVFGDKWIRPKPAENAGKAAVAAAPAAAANPDVPVLLGDRYKAIAKSIDVSRVESSVKTLSSYPSRMVGYPGCDAAANYIEKQFKDIGLQDVKTEEFKVTVPVDEGSKLVVGNQEFPIYALWPNLVRTSHLPPEGLDVHVIDAGSGKLPDFDGKKVEGSAALIDFNSGTEWLNAPRLGARAVIFVEPSSTMRGEGEAKFSSIPVSMPRFWISKDNAAKVRELIKAGRAETAKVFCTMPWEKVKTRNIIGVIRGTDPEFKNQWIVLHAAYDGTSVVPALAPGAESSCGMAGLLELARLYKNPQFAPKRSIMFVANSAHFQSLGGMREFMERHIDEYKTPTASDKIHSFLNANWSKGSSNKAFPWLPILIAIALLLVVLWIANLLKSIRRRYAWVNAIPILLAIAVIIYSANLFTAFSKGFDYKVPNPRQFFVWAGLDLSSNTEGVGLFYKGYFYDIREDIQGNFSDLAGRTRENSERVAYALGFLPQKDNRFADGVNPISGKNWRNFVPGKFALDSEVVTLAGGKGVSFVSMNDGRQKVDTPFDTVDQIRFDNIIKQLTMIACLSDHWMRDTNKPIDEDYAPAKIVDNGTISVTDPLRIGFVQGVYTNKFGRGKNYYKPKTEKDMPASLAQGEIKLTENLPANTKNVFILHKPLTKIGVATPCNFTRMGLQGGLARLSGSVVQYDPRKSFVPNLNVDDCLAVVRSNYKSFMGVRANIVDKTTEVEGKFVIPGMAPVTAGGRGTSTQIGAYKLDPVRGDIIMAPDQGSYGQFYPTTFPITTALKDMPVIVFDCKATSIYDLIDPQSLRALGGMSIYDGDTDGAPKQYGSAVALPEPGNPHVEDMAVIFTEDTAKSKKLAVGSSDELRRVRIKIVMSAGPAANRLLLLNSTLGDEVAASKVVSVVDKAIPINGAWQPAVTGVFANKDCKGKNYFKGIADAVDTESLMLGQVTTVKGIPAKTTEAYVKTSQGKVISARILRTMRVSVPWFVKILGIYTDKDCESKNYYIPETGKRTNGEVDLAEGLPAKTRFVYVKTDSDGIVKDKIVLVSDRVILNDNSWQVAVQGVYTDKKASGKNYLASVANMNAHVLSGAGIVVTGLPKNTDNVFIKTDSAEIVPAKAHKVLDLGGPVDFFVQGIYTDKDCKGKNFANYKDGMYNSASLLSGQIDLTAALPSGAKEVYVKPVVDPEGIGYDFTMGGTLDETAFKVARDMWTLDEYRLKKLESKGVKNDGLRALHNTAKDKLDQAAKAKDSLNYSVFDSYCRAAWGYECRSYPDVTKTAQDVVNGVIFYLFLMLPFAFFCERLFFAYPDLKWQLLAFFGIFIGIFFVFRVVHPAFQIAGNAPIVLIAFIMLSLSLLVISIITSKFEEQLKQFNRSVSGIHKADIGRMSVAAAAFSLGISNMRRRKARTVLTCITLILLTFTVLSFTSIVSVLRFNKVPAKKDVDTHIYDGIMIRTAMWDAQEETAYRLLKDEFGNEGKHGKVYPVAPRSWFYGTVPGEQSFLTVKRGDNAYDARAACGMTPDEAQIMDFETANKKVFVAGEWFGYKNGKRVPGKVDPFSMIIPQAIADKLQIKPEDVGKAKVEFGGSRYTVIAILNSSVFKRMKDLDNEPLTPVDFIMMSKQSQAQQQQSASEAGFREYTHIEPDNVFIVPFETLMNMGGDVRSIAIKFATFDEVQTQLDALMPRLGLNLYAGIGSSIYRYSSIAASSSKGLSNVFIPVLIAALIVLNTMLGSVYERVKEIGIFSAIGLAPNHIAILFIAESLVYANLGAVAGYVLGQTASKILMATNWLPGLYLNFSSMSAVMSSIVVVAVVILSTLYPARKASEVATPSVERSWKVPDPVGDNWDIVLPFAVTGEQAVGVNCFLREWFQAYEEYSIGDFVTQDVESSEEDVENGKVYRIKCKTWLAPFDLGVSQMVALNTVPTNMEDVYEVQLRITRESGDVSNWKRVNRRFLNTLRKQFLIWRTLRAEDREKYLSGAVAEESTATEAAPVN